MNRILTLILCIFSLCSAAQTDSVSLGAGAANMVFYSLDSGVQGTAANNDWHLAFSARQIAGYDFSQTNQATAIRINEAYGLKLFRNPGQKLAQFASFDTAGYESWQQMHNPDTTWTIGAFNVNINLSDPFNFGWGEYNQADHNIYGDSSMYLIVLPDGTFKKFVILSLVYDTAFNVQFANLDNSNPVTMSVSKNPYLTKNFVYLNLETTNLMDKEPALTAWDMMFLRYNNTVYDSANLTQDIGVLTKDADNVYAASGSAAQQSCYSGTGFYNDINTIGKNWMGQPADTAIPGLAYFIQSSSGTYKMAFTGLGGAATGVVDFTVNKCSNTAAGIAETGGAGIDISIYPVPASDEVNISIATDEETNMTVQLLDMTGRAILSQNIAAHAGENNFTLYTASVQAGNYIVALSSAGGKINKLISIVK
jgi:hypothetical protein